MKKSVEITALNKGPESSSALVVAYEEQEVDGQVQKVPLGEAAITFKNSMTDKKVVELAKTTAAAIIKQANEAKAKREALNKLLETEVVE